MNFVQQIGETLRSIDLGSAIGASGFKTVDLVILVVYLVVLVALGLFLGRTKKGEQKSANDYFLAGNTLTWWAVGASLIAANISAEQFIGMSGTGFRDGIATAAYEIMAAVTLIVIGKFLLPVMLKQKIFTIPQFLRERYNDGVGLAFSVLWLFLYIFVNLTSVAWLGALAIEQILGLQGVYIALGETMISMRMVIIVVLFIVAGIYSIYGGLASVAWTDVMQVFFLVGGVLSQPGSPSRLPVTVLLWKVSGMYIQPSRLVNMRGTPTSILSSSSRTIRALLQMCLVSWLLWVLYGLQTSVTGASTSTSSRRVLQPRVWMRLRRVLSSPASSSS